MKTIIDQLWRATEEHPNLNVYAILDAARDTRIYRRLDLFSGEYLCLYLEPLPVELARVAPYLVELKKNSALTQWLLKRGWRHSWGIFALSSEDLFDTVSHFRRFIKIRDEDDKRLYFRYYDPRVMRVYLPTCTYKELKYVFGPVQHYLMETPQGHLIRFSLQKNQLQQTLVQL